jgi:hypothetical protein
MNDKAAVTLILLFWFVLGCNFSDIPQENRQKATILSMKGSEIETDHGRFVSNTPFKAGDTIWIVKDAEGYFCLCTDDAQHECYHNVPPGAGGEGVKRRPRPRPH